MINLFKNILLFIILTLPVLSFAQECHNVVKYCPHSHREGFVFNMQVQVEFSFKEILQKFLSSFIKEWSIKSLFVPLIIPN